MAIHCLGTWAIEQALNSFEAALRERHVEEPRFRIEHYGFPTPDLMRRAASLGVVPVVQPPFVYTGGDSAVSRAAELGGTGRGAPVPVDAGRWAEGGG